MPTPMVGLGSCVQLQRWLSRKNSTESKLHGSKVGVRCFPNVNVKVSPENKSSGFSPNKKRMCPPLDTEWRTSYPPLTYCSGCSSRKEWNQPKGFKGISLLQAIKFKAAHFAKYSLSAHYVVGTILGAVDPSVSQPAPRQSSPPARPLPENAVRRTQNLLFSFLLF